MSVSPTNSLSRAGSTLVSEQLIFPLPISPAHLGGTSQSKAVKKGNPHITQLSTSLHEEERVTDRHEFKTLATG